MNQIDPFLPAVATLRGDLRDLMISAAQRSPKSWAQMSEAEQTATAEYLNALSAEIITRIALIVATQGKPAVVAKLESVSVTDTCKAVLSVQPQQVAGLIPCTKQLVAVMPLDVAGLMGQRGPASVVKDEPELPLPGMGETSGGGGGTHAQAGSTVEITISEGGSGGAAATSATGTLAGGGGASEPAPRAKPKAAKPQPETKKEGSPFRNG